MVAAMCSAPRDDQVRVVDGDDRLLPGAGMRNMFGKPAVIMPKSVLGPSVHFSAMVTPSRPTIVVTGTSGKGVSSASKPVA